MIWTLGLYFFRRYMLTSLWFLLGVVSITYLIDFTETSGRFDSLPGYSVPGVLYLTALRLPLILQQTIPFIGLFVGMAIGGVRLWPLAKAIIPFVLMMLVVLVLVTYVPVFSLALVR